MAVIGAVEALPSSPWRTTVVPSPVSVTSLPAPVALMATSDAWTPAPKAIVPPELAAAEMLLSTVSLPWLAARL